MEAEEINIDNVEPAEDQGFDEVEGNQALNEGGEYQ